MPDNFTVSLPSGVSSSSVTVLDQGSQERKNALYSGQINATVQGMYSLALIDTSDNELSVLYDERLDPAKRSSAAEYFFRVPPQQHEVTEPFSTTIIATQNGGKFIESHGSILKSIRLSGTTGLRPNKKTSSLQDIPLFGSAIAGQQESFVNTLSGKGFNLQDRNTQTDEATGYDDIILLRNLFRHYSDLKESAPNARNILMLWRNAKDAEYWVVEPLEFKLTRDSSSPLTYKYDIGLKTLSRFTASVTVQDPLSAALSTQRFFSRVQEYRQSLKRTFLVVSTQISRLEALGIFAQTELLTPIIDVIQGLGLVKTTTTRLGTRLRTNAQTLQDNLHAAIAVLEGTDNLYENEKLYRLARQLKRELFNISRVLTEALFRNTLGSDTPAAMTRHVQAYNAASGEFGRERKAPTTGGSSTFIGNERNASAVAQGTVHSNEDIRAVAARLLGDRGRWQILALLNKLRAPYIGPVGSPGVLAPGDTILYPLEANQAVSARVLGRADVTEDQAEGPEQGNLGPIQQAYGRDLRLRSVPASSTGITLTDLSVSQRGDLNTIVGIPNVIQALRLKFATEKGTLTVHPAYGSRFPIGTKATSVAFNEYRIQAESTLSSDSRVRQVKNIRFNTVGDVLTVHASIELLDSADAINTSIALRRL